MNLMGLVIAVTGAFGAGVLLGCKWEAERWAAAASAGRAIIWDWNVYRFQPVKRHGPDLGAGE